MRVLCCNGIGARGSRRHSRRTGAVEAGAGASESSKSTQGSKAYLFSRVFEATAQLCTATFFGCFALDMLALWWLRIVSKAAGQAFEVVRSCLYHGHFLVVPNRLVRKQHVLESLDELEKVANVEVQ